jgi:hypothetical protein
VTDLDAEPLSLYYITMSEDRLLAGSYRYFIKSTAGNSSMLGGNDA